MKTFRIVKGRQRSKGRSPRVQLRGLSSAYRSVSDVRIHIRGHFLNHRNIAHCSAQISSQQKYVSLFFSPCLIYVRNGAIQVKSNGDHTNEMNFATVICRDRNDESHYNNNVIIIASADIIIILLGV